MQNRQSKMVDASHFAMIPRADIPRATFNVESGYKTTFDVGYLVPIYVQEILPGDVMEVHMTAFTRLSTLIFPLMDSLELCSFFFFVPNRLVWEHWQNFMGEQKPDPSSSTNYTIPQIQPISGYVSGTIYDYMGLPVITAHSATALWSHTALPLRAYNLIYNEWFRDENLQNSAPIHTDDGPDPVGDYQTLSRAKRHDYFTSALPFAQKGTAASIPLTGLAPVTGLGLATLNSQTGPDNWYETDGTIHAYGFETASTSVPNNAAVMNPHAGAGGVQALGIQQNANGYPQVFANLNAVTVSTINALRQAFQIQKLLERDARGGTRYIELLRSHFGVTSPDARLQRPEYLGGGCSPVTINPVAQTSVTSTTPLGNLAGVGTSIAGHGYKKAFVEHGYVIGIINIRANVSYQQGLNRMWSRLTRYDFYWPAFAHLGEQTILGQEIDLMGGGAASDLAVFGYQERFAEYRYRPSLITGMFRSGIGGTLDSWHLSEYYTSPPTLNDAWIRSKAPLSRVLAAGSLADGQQFLFDSIFSHKMTRLMPLYSVPGFVDRF